MLLRRKNEKRERFCPCAHGGIAEFVAGGHILPTSNPQAVADAVLESCSRALTYDGVMYGYPVAAETYALFYNRAMVSDEEVPRTWEDLRDFAIKFNAENPGKYAFVMDVGNAYYTFIFAALEVAFIAILPFIFSKVHDLITLGEPSPPGTPITQKDRSIFMLVDGILALSIAAIFAVMYFLSVRSAKSGYSEYCQRKGHITARLSLSQASGKAFPIFALAPAFLLVVFFVVVPLVFSACVAFTNYSSPGHIPPNNTVDWVGFQNFVDLMGGSATWSQGFARVAAWNLVWAVLATVTCYFGGLIVAVLLKEINFRIAPVFRVIFILPYAVPSVISMLVWQNLLNGTFGIVNRTLTQMGAISNPIPWLSDPVLARVTIVLVNLWAGFGYFMLLTTGTMTAISEDMYEAAKIDGATRFQTLRYITLPLVMYQTMPLIIMSFTHNINNFGAVFFLTGGGPQVADSTVTSAGATDLLITWIYKLTVNLLKYNYASVIAAIIFIVLTPFAIFNFRRTRAYKEGNL